MPIHPIQSTTSLPTRLRNGHRKPCNIYEDSGQGDGDPQHGYIHPPELAIALVVAYNLVADHLEDHPCPTTSSPE